MPVCETKYFGAAGYDEGAVVEFPGGLPGFESRRRFILLEQPAHKPVVFLQSLDDPQLCFVTLPVLVIDAHYELKMPAEDLAVLDFTAGRQPGIGDGVACLAIVSVSENGSATANLLAPVVIRACNGRAVQAVREDSRYSCRHQIAQPQGAAPCW